MNTLKENYKIIDGKIQLLRDEILSLVYRLKEERIDKYGCSIITPLELANLHAWKAQLTNNGFKVPPFIEPEVKVYLPELSLENIFQKLSKCLVQLVSIIETAQELEMIAMGNTNDENEQFGEEFGEEFVDELLAELEQISAKDQQTFYSINRVLDCLNDVILLTQQEMERTND